MAVDFITGLPDFNEFITICDEHLDNNSRGRFAVVINDVSNFKFINKLYSHETGDLFIWDMADFFFRNNPHVICACRIDSEQFSALLDIKGLSREEELEFIAIKNAEFEQLMSNKFPDIFIHVYTGVYFMPNNRESFRLAYDKAKMSKARIKGHLDVSYCVYDPEDYEVSENIMEASSLFRRALDEDRIVAFLQPKYSVSKDCVVGAEVLARIIEIDGSIVPPGRFIPALEKTGIIGTLDRIMIEKTFALVKRWKEEGKQLIPISVNVSRQVFIKPDFVDHMKQLQKVYDVPPEYVDFEILESMFVDNMDYIVNTTNELRKYGFNVSMDDFGSHIVFEGIETEEQKDLVSGYGCDVIQGYFYSKPIPVKEFEDKYFS